MRVQQSFGFLLSLTLGLVATLGSVSFADEYVFKPTEEAPVARPTAPDTLRQSVQAGAPLIVSLPAERDTVSIDRYDLIRGPALSGVAGRSFAWVTRSDDIGTHTILLRPVASAPLPDTLAMVVTVE